MDMEPLKFRMVVPQQMLLKSSTHVFCRRTKNLADRHEKYVEHGMIVAGHVEEDGDWVCLKAGVFLPMRMGGFKFLEPMPLQDVVCYRPP